MTAADLYSVAQVLAYAQTLKVPRLDAQLLLAYRLGCSRAWLLAHPEAPLTAQDSERLKSQLARRRAGEPLAYLVGTREFHGIELGVTRDVLVPRPDTETLVDWALELLEGPLSGIAEPTVVDLGTGSGAIALAIKRSCRRADVHGTDISTAALDVARANGTHLGLQVAWHRGPWWKAVQSSAVPTVHLALANPPYIAPEDPHLEALIHEPRSALVPANDSGNGLADLERIIAGAATALGAGAWLLLEHGHLQSLEVRQMLALARFDLISTRADLAGHPRVSAGRLRA